MKIVVAIDSFKGCLSSKEAGETVKQAIKKQYPTYEVEVYQIADGGEGTLSVLVQLLGAKYVSCQAHDPLMRTINGEYAIVAESKTALIEMASVNGLPLLKEEERNPMLTSTFGTGELIKDALDRGCQHFIIGIGGSATNDAGVGLLQAIGYRFYDKKGKEIGKGGSVLPEIASWEEPDDTYCLKKSDFTIACDVNNPFYGKNGAAYVYARQKGADNEMIQLLDKGLESFCNVIRKKTGIDIENIPGSGAAGGMGGGMLAFLKARLRPGADLLLELSDFVKTAQTADLIITGEGKMDKQTLMGKIPGRIMEIGKKNKVSVVGIAGKIEDYDALEQGGFNHLYAISPISLPLELAMKPEIAKENIEKSIAGLLQNYK